MLFTVCCCCWFDGLVDWLVCWFVVSLLLLVSVSFVDFVERLRVILSCCSLVQVLVYVVLC